MLINLAFTGGGALIGFILTSFRSALESHKKTDTDLLEKVQRIEVLVAGKYVTYEQLDKKMDTLTDALRRIEDKQGNNANNNVKRKNLTDYQNGKHKIIR